MCHRGILHRPLLYLSYYLKHHRPEYYDRLMAIRDGGDWEGWFRFFLRGVAETAEEATSTARAIVEMREQHRALLQKRDAGINGLRLLDLLFQRPILNVSLVRDELRIAYATANKLADQFQELGLLDETTGGQRNRRYRYTPYLQLFRDPDPFAVEDGQTQATESGL